MPNSPAMELRHLRYFIAVAEELNFGRAADRLHVSKPTLSQQIKDLESTLGVQLLDRNTTSVRVTVPGEAFLPEARQVIAQSERAIAVAHDAAQGRRGLLRIGNAATLSHGFMPACLRIFRREYPDVDVNLVEVDLNEQIIAVKSARIDLGFTLQREGSALAGLKHYLAVRSPLRVVLALAHPLARKKTISLADVARESLLSIGGPKASSHRDNLSRLLVGRGMKNFSFTVVPGYEAFLAMVASGQGVSLLPKMPSIAAVEGLTTRSLVESGPDLIFEVRAVWRTGESQLLANFVQLLQKTCVVT
jgi:DNA-binding transcriptional LysR family regulator